MRSQPSLSIAHRALFGLLIVALSVGFISPIETARGAIIVLKNQAEPVLGLIVRQEKGQLVVKVRDESGKLRDQTLERKEVAEIIETVSPQRLQALNPKSPEAYRDYAEELAAKQRDWEARETAIRLYAIAFHLERAKLGKSALRGLISLARSPQEEQQFRAALFILDPRQILDDLPTSKNAAEVKKERNRWEETLRGVQLLRRGQGAAARPIFAKAEVAKVLQGYEAFISRSELETACKEISLTDRRLRQLLLLELALESHRAPPAEQSLLEDVSPAWGSDLQSGGNNPVPVIDLDRLTEFDMRQTIYRDGKWIAP